MVSEAGAGSPEAAVARPVTVVVAAKDEAARIGATVTAARSIPGVTRVVVVDDGSSDRTAVVARSAGAHVVRHRRNLGKAAAMQTGVRAARKLDRPAGDGEGGEGDAPGTRHATGSSDEAGSEESASPRPLLLFLDADLGASAAQGGELIAPVRDGSADMTIAILPEQATAGGGVGLVVQLARGGIRRATGWVPTQPLSGQRCLSAATFAAALPLASGFGVETGLTIDLLRRGFRVLEVPCDLHHRVTGRDLRSQVHRGRQYRDVAVALASRGVLPARLHRVPAQVARRSAAWRDRVRRG